MLLIISTYCISLDRLFQHLFRLAISVASDSQKLSRFIIDEDICFEVAVIFEYKTLCHRFFAKANGSKINNIARIHDDSSRSETHYEGMLNVGVFITIRLHLNMASIL